jgi:hypothetical protein
MSRSGYDDCWDCDDWQAALAMRRVASAMRGRRGQRLFRDLVAALDAMPAKRLITDDLIREDSTGFENVCALGAVGKQRGIDMKPLDPENPHQVAAAFDISPTLAREVVYENDEGAWGRETPEQRWARVRAWAASKIKAPSDTSESAGLVGREG